MSSPRDVVGLPYSEALERLHAAGHSGIRLQVTRPPRATAGRGLLRVIGYRDRTLVVSYEGWEEPPRPVRR